MTGVTKSGNTAPAARTDGKPEDLRAADSAAFEALVREQAPVLRSIAMNLCKDPTEAHDVVQDTLERAFRTFKRLSGEVSPRPWLATILRNRVIDGWRSGRLRQTETLEGVDAHNEEPEEKPRWAAITDTQLRAAIDQLPDEFRLAYRMHALEGRTYKEIAAVLGVPSATVGTRMLRARRRLRDLLEPHLGEDE